MKLKELFERIGCFAIFLGPSYQKLAMICTGESNLRIIILHMVFTYDYSLLRDILMYIVTTVTSVVKVQLCKFKKH